MSSSIILHIPHSSTKIPAHLNRAFLLDRQSLHLEAQKSADYLTDKIFRVTKAKAVIAPVSRLVVDTERFSDDTQEIMSQKGLGAVYTRTWEGKRLRKKPTSDERHTLLQKYYWPHHYKLQLLTERILKKHNAAIIVDCHSYPTIAPTWEGDSHKKRPQVCIGVDNYHSPAGLYKQIVKIFENDGYSVVLNQPYKGTLIPQTFYKKDPRVLGLMIELRKDTYLDETNFQANANYTNLQQTLKKVFTSIEAYMLSLHNRDEFAIIAGNAINLYQ